MNISLIKKKNIYFLTLIIAFFAPSILYSGNNHEIGIPFYYNITPKDNGYSNVNYSFAQDNRNIIYIGNFNGVLEYDGVFWREIKISGNPILSADNYGRIFCAGFNEFGQILPDKTGKNKYQQIFLDTSNSLGQISTLIHEYSNIYISNKKSIYCYNNKSIKLLIADSSSASIYQINHKLYASTGNGIYRINPNNSIETLLKNPFNADETVILLLPCDNDLICVTNKACYKISNNRILPFSNSLNKIINQFSIISGVRLSDGSYALGSERGGIFFCDINGNITNFANRNSGLYDNKIQNLFVDNSDLLWAAFSNGVAVINYPSSLTSYNNSIGLEGSVNSIVRFNNQLFVATTNGLFSFTENLQNEIKLNKIFNNIEPFTFECYYLLSTKDYLLIAAKKGLFIYKNGKTNKIDDKETNYILKSQYDENIFYLAQNYNISKIEIINGNISKTLITKDINANITTLAEDSISLWLGTQMKGVFSIRKDNFNEVEKIINYNQGKGLPTESKWIDVYPTSKGTLFSTYAGLYRFDYELNRFYKDNKILIPFNSEKKRVAPIIEDKNNNIWLSYEVSDYYQKQIAVAWNIENIDRYTLISQPFNKLNNHVFDVIYPDENFVVWFGGFNELIRLDFKQLTQDSTDIATLIRKIELKGDSTLSYAPEFNSYFKENFVEIPYNLNSIKFTFSTPSFDNKEKSKHQYYLEGYDKEWSEYEDITQKEYTNLPPGKYYFKVRSQNIYNYKTNEAIFQFIILEPFYSTWWAIVGYILVGISFIIAITRWRAYNFAKEKTNLEKIITERTEELLHEKEKTERLLANILPERTVKELKDKGKATSMRFSMVTVLFSDIQGFTKIAEKMNPDRLVDELDKFFLQFDSVVERCNIEKIKTIGDAYMCAGGIPQKNKTNPIEVVTAALEMQYYIAEMKKQANDEGSDYWGLRIGIHTGPVVAGVIGSKKFTYDIWGDSVNIASRMESSGEVGRVNISEDTYLLIKQYFDCEYRGRMPVKYKGDIDMYFVHGFKSTYADENNQLFPNKKFINKLNLLKYEDLGNLHFRQTRSRTS